MSAATGQHPHEASEGACSTCDNLKPGPLIRKIPHETLWAGHGSSAACPYCQLVRDIWLGFYAKEWPFGPSAGRCDDDNIYVKVQDEKFFKILPFMDSDFRDASGHAVEIYTTRSGTSLKPSPPKLPEITSSFSGDPETLAFLQTCLKTCLREHDSCRNPMPSWRPPTLVMFTETDGEIKLKLVETATLDDCPIYVALSHCWGKSQMLRTLQGNRDSFKKSIGWNQLPRTFQDALTIAQKFQIKHVWIDSLCIVQDDVEDWSRQSSNMDKVYQNALFTISADSSREGGEPFLGPEALNYRYLMKPADVKYGPDIVRARWTWGSLAAGLVVGPLQCRAWAYQERYLSVRNMHFMGEEVQWACRTEARCECASPRTRKAVLDGPLLYSAHTLSSNNASSFEKNWNEIIAHFSGRKLTRVTDVLPSLSGIAARFNAMVPAKRYVCGMWDPDIREYMLWATQFPYSLAPLDYHGRKELGPSWSWISSPVPVNRYNPYRWEESKTWLLDVEELHWEPKHSNIYGEVTVGAHILVRGKLFVIPIEVYIYDEKEFGNRPWQVARTGSKSEFGVRLDMAVSPLSSLTVTKYGHSVVTFMRAYQPPWPSKGQSYKVSGYVHFLPVNISERESKHRYVHGIVLGLEATETGGYTRLGILSDMKAESWDPCEGTWPDWMIETDETLIRLE